MEPEAIARWAAEKFPDVERDDAIQEALLAIWKSQATYNPRYGTKPETWACRQALGAISNMRHKERRYQARHAKLDDLERIGGTTCISDKHILAEEIMSRADLDPEERELILMRCADLSYRAIAARVGYSYDKVWRRDKAAKAKLKSMFPDSDII